MRGPVGVLVLVACLTALGGVGARAEVIDRVLATVGPAVITLSDLHAAQTFGLRLTGSNPRTPAETLGALVDRELMLGEVRRFAAPEPDRARVDRRMAQIRAAFTTPEAYQQALARTAMTEERLRSFVTADLQIDDYVVQRFAAPVPPTADEVQRFYADHRADFTREGRLLPLDEVRAQAQERFAAERQRSLVVQWLERLRRGTHIEIHTAGLAALK